jgi:hypothetical protein
MSVLLENYQVVVKAFLQRNCQLSWQIVLHLLTHVLEVNSSKLLENTLVQRVVLLTTQL